MEFLDAEKVCFKIFDGTHESPKARNRGRLMITSKNLQSNSIDFSGASLISEDDFQKIQKRSRVKQWDILFSMIGSVGRVYLEESSNPDYAIKNKVSLRRRYPEIPESKRIKKIPYPYLFK